MPLLNRNNFPPGGFQYFEPKLNWWAPRDGIGFNLKAQQIQAVRVANPASGLDPSYEACEEALELYTCTRLANDPKWCVAVTSPVAQSIAASRKVPKCGGCGARRNK